MEKYALAPEHGSLVRCVKRHTSYGFVREVGDVFRVRRNPPDSTTFRMVRISDHVWTGIFYDQSLESFRRCFVGVNSEPEEEII
jgi:hypothetical protein